MINLRVGGVPEHFNLPWHLAIEQDLLSPLKVQIAWQDFGGGTGAMMQALRQEQLDIALVLTEGAVADIAKGNDARIVQVYVNTPLHWGIHVAADSDIQEITTEIFDKKYAISRFGSGSHLMALVHAAQHQRSIAAEQWVQVGNLDGAEKALVQHQADVFMWERAMTQPLVDNGTFRRVGVCPTPWPCFVVVVRTKVLQEHSSLIHNILRVIGGVAQDFKNNPAAANMVAQRYGLQVANAEKWRQETEWNYEATPPLHAQIEPAAQALFSLGIVEQQPLWNELVQEIC